MCSGLLLQITFSSSWNVTLVLIADAHTGQDPMGKKMDKEVNFFAGFGS